MSNIAKGVSHGCFSQELSIGQQHDHSKDILDLIHTISFDLGNKFSVESHWPGILSEKVERLIDDFITTDSFVVDFEIGHGLET